MALLLSNGFPHWLQSDAPVGMTSINYVKSIDAYDNVLLSLNPIRYYKFNEAEDSTESIDILGNGYNAITKGSSIPPTYGIDSILPGSPATAARISSASGQALTINIQNAVLNDTKDGDKDVSINFHFKSSSTSAIIFSIMTQYDTYVIDVGIDATGNLYVTDYMDAAPATYTYSQVNDGAMHSVGVRLGEGLDGSVFLDGVKVGDGVLHNVIPTNDMMFLGIGHNDFENDTMDMDFQSLSIFQYELGSGDFETLHLIANSPYLSTNLTVTVADIINQSISRTTSRGDFSNTVEQLLTNSTASGIFWQITVQQLITHSQTVQVLFDNIVRVIQSISNIQNPNPTMQYAVTILQQLANYTAAVYFQSVLVQESITASQLTQVIHKMNELIQELFTCDASGNIADIRLLATVNENVNITDTSSLASFFRVALHENLSFVVAIPESDDLYYTFTANTTNLALSEYDGYQFTHLSEGLACNKLGIYDLNDPEDEEIIKAHIVTGLSNFGTSKHKQVPYAYLALTNDNDVILSTTTMQSGNKKTRMYRLQLHSDATETRRVSLGKGVKSSLWQFTLENVDGAEFELTDMEILPLTLNRRR